MTFTVVDRIGHFRVAPSLCFEVRLTAKILMWKWFFYSHANETHSHKKGFLLLASFWKWEFLELQLWTKVLGHFCVSGVFSNSHRPTPSLTPQTMLDACIQNFFRVSILYRVGGGRTAREFRKGFTVLRGNREMTEKYEYWSTVLRTFVQDCRNLEMCVFEEREKPEYPEKNLSEQGREPTTNWTCIWLWVCCWLVLLDSSSAVGRFWIR